MKREDKLFGCGCKKGQVATPTTTTTTTTTQATTAETTPTVQPIPTVGNS